MKLFFISISIIVLLSPLRIVSTRGYDYDSGESFNRTTEICISENAVLIKDYKSVIQYVIHSKLQFNGHTVYKLNDGVVLDKYPRFIILRSHPHHKEVAYYGFLE